jgi:hypothetical protein
MQCTDEISITNAYKLNSMSMAKLIPDLLYKLNSMKANIYTYYFLFQSIHVRNFRFSVHFM